MVKKSNQFEILVASDTVAFHKDIKRIRLLCLQYNIAYTWGRRNQKLAGMLKFKNANGTKL